MLNYLWGGMILIAVVYGTLTGRIEAVGTAAVNSSKEAVELCITMLGVMALWTGIMKIAEVSGLTKKFLRLARPVLRFLFPDVPEDSKANDYIASNMLANILGLGWAATPFGLKAMTELQKINIAQGGKKEKKHTKDIQCIRETSQFTVHKTASFLVLIAVYQKWCPLKCTLLKRRK